MVAVFPTNHQSELTTKMNDVAAWFKDSYWLFVTILSCDAKPSPCSYVASYLVALEVFQDVFVTKSSIKY
jgi:hypothetical protein